MEQRDIDSIARQVASANLKSDSVANVVTEPMVDSQGDAALKVTIVLTPGSTSSISGDDALKTLFEMQQRLQAAGENRFAFIEYATEDELAAGAD